MNPVYLSPKLTYRAIANYMKVERPTWESSKLVIRGLVILSSSRYFMKRLNYVQTQGDLSYYTEENPKWEDRKHAI